MYELCLLLVVKQKHTETHTDMGLATSLKI